MGNVASGAWFLGVLGLVAGITAVVMFTQAAVAQSRSDRWVDEVLTLGDDCGFPNRAFTVESCMHQARRQQELAGKNRQTGLLATFLGALLLGGAVLAAVRVRRGTPDTPGADAQDGPPEERVRLLEPE